MLITILLILIFIAILSPELAVGILKLTLYLGLTAIAVFGVIILIAMGAN